MFPSHDNLPYGDIVDFSEVWSEKPIGDSSVLYAEWIRTSPLPTDYNTIAELAALASFQFKLTVDSITKNIKGSFTGCTTWDELNSRLSAAIKLQFPNCYSEYNRTYETFTIINYTANGRITAVSAGDGATDISTVLSGSETRPAPAMYASLTLAGLEPPETGVSNSISSHFTRVS